MTTPDIPTAPIPLADLAADLAEAPDLAAVAAAHPEAWKTLLTAWSQPDPDYEPLTLPDSPSVDRGLPARHDRPPGDLFTTPEHDVAPLFDDRRTD